MFNSSVRREAREKLEKAVNRHEFIRKSVERASVQLFKQRQRAAGEVIERVEEYVNLLSNSPKEFERSVARYRIEVSRFDKTVQRLDVEAIKASNIASTTGAVGGTAGVGVAALGPTAAMAVATTFGTASTGTAISALSGAAATNAALAWLGGGAIAAGGGGMAAGKVLLAFAGPVGWTIGGLALGGSAIYLNKRNKEIAEKATQERVKVEAEVRSLETANREIKGLGQRTKEHSEGCLAGLDWLTNHAPKNYRQFNLGQKERLTALINHIRSLSQLLKAEVAL
ncbi:MAG: hypothetical protein F4Z57_05550 [Gemmatimonadetes bacterium]|nr:hypothetical protein [Gemmatimonadota bacterium]MYC73203.1 hypothetical protein [Gemmatimonadota bacterium]MYI64118.1 hypothetical protein [Gemmatimonadota bacterium]